MTTVTMMKMITEAARAVPSFGFAPALSGLVVGVVVDIMLGGVMLVLLVVAIAVNVVQGATLSSLLLSSLSLSSSSSSSLRERKKGLLRTRSLPIKSRRMKYLRKKMSGEKNERKIRKRITGNLLRRWRRSQRWK